MKNILSALSLALLVGASVVANAMRRGRTLLGGRFSKVSDLLFFRI